jgi:GNAT superfamily N-acetyltransferase
MIALLDAQYPARAVRPGSTTEPDEMAPPHGCFLVGFVDERPVAVGGLRRLDDDVCEIKRMYVVPGARSAGVGRALLLALEDAGRELGYRRVRVDAGIHQTHSIGLFERTGYQRIPAYNANYIAVYFGEKSLA